MTYQPMMYNSALNQSYPPSSSQDVHTPMHTDYVSVPVHSQAQYIPLNQSYPPPQPIDTSKRQQRQQRQQQRQQLQQQQQPPMSNTRTNFFKYFDKVHVAGKPVLDRVGSGVNKLTNKMGSEAFCPMTLDQESDKAARILRSFCQEGYYSKVSNEQANQARLNGFFVEGPQGNQRIINKIPPEVIRNAKGLAIYTVMRTGLHFSGAGGSGIVIARLQDGSWSPPSAIVVHTLGVGLVAGIDIYDCVVVINTDEGLDGFTRFRGTIGGEISAAAGPVGGGAMVDTEFLRRPKALWTYTKSRGLYVGVQIDGTIVGERHTENERYYGVRGIRTPQILSGLVHLPPPQQAFLSPLWETLSLIDGRMSSSSYPSTYPSTIPTTIITHHHHDDEREIYPSNSNSGDYSTVVQSDYTNSSSVYVGNVGCGVVNN
eukprot:TRINITY_DN3377_c0_g1_i1.p1 TRINITY_DN3377_c0_g1~~TRINITY_DN3377_c0_g1_i1.p1  ORF type:complete len:428 (-),score=107.50 TRINITY_DN3377_c0_g1_i1:29-1312(-)